MSIKKNVGDFFDCGTYVGNHIGKEIRHSIGDELPKREWVGLTDEEIISMSCYDLEWAALIGEVQRKLKEKNT